MSDELGIDLAVEPDLGRTFQLVKGKDCLAQDLLHRLSTPRGGLFYNTNYGRDLRSYLGKRLRPGEQFRIQAEIVNEVRQDPRVSDASAQITFAQNKLTLLLTVDTKEGPFALVILATPELVTLTKESQ